MVSKEVLVAPLVAKIKGILEQDPYRRFVTFYITQTTTHLQLSFWVTPCEMSLKLLLDTCMPSGSFAWLYAVPDPTETFVKLTADGLADGLPDFKINEIKTMSIKGAEGWSFTLEKQDIQPSA